VFETSHLKTGIPVAALTVDATLSDKARQNGQA
jgi:hypothetical protein